jgi:hypothetical protein
MPAIREVHADDWCVRLDLSRQVLALEVPESVFGWRPEGEHAGSLLSTPPAAGSDPVSAATLLLKAKQFDDGLYAAVELAAQHGAGGFAGRAALLRSLAGTLTADLPAAEDAAATVLAACELGDLSVEVPPYLRNRVRTLAADFLGNGLASKPLGFYTWTPGLSAIFRQDRLLQQPLDPDAADTLARTLHRTPGALAAHDALLRLNARLTNPPARPGLRDGAGRRAFLPASRSHEQVLVERLFGDRPIPDNFDLMTELIRRMRSGEIDPKPTERSGWYDYQTWSLEPLLMPERMPEAARVNFGERYRKHLEDLFRGALALARETHVKQLAVAVGGCAGPVQRPILVRPDLTVEPLPSVFARRAASYGFVRSVLEEAFGVEALGGLHRLTQEGTCRMPLSDELNFIEKLFEGAAVAARRELGMEAGPGDDEDARHFADWRANLAADLDVSRDCRMMVPVYFDVRRRKAKVWTFLGWRTVPVDAAYATEPSVLGVQRERPPEPEAADRLSLLRRRFRRQPEPQSAGPPPVEFSGDRYEFAVPVTAEVYVSRLLDRNEFRRHCDRHRTRDAILANLD